MSNSSSHHATKPRAAKSGANRTNPALSDGGHEVPVPRTPAFGSWRSNVRHESTKLHASHMDPAEHGGVQHQSFDSLGTNTTELGRITEEARKLAGLRQPHELKLSPPTYDSYPEVTEAVVVGSAKQTSRRIFYCKPKIGDLDSQAFSDPKEPPRSSSDISPKVPETMIGSSTETDSDPETSAVSSEADLRPKSKLYLSSQNHEQDVANPKATSTPAETGETLEATAFSSRSDIPPKTEQLFPSETESDPDPTGVISSEADFSDGETSDELHDEDEVAHDNLSVKDGELANRTNECDSKNVSNAVGEPVRHRAISPSKQLGDDSAIGNPGLLQVATEEFGQSKTNLFPSRGQGIESHAGICRVLGDSEDGDEVPDEVKKLVTPVSKPSSHAIQKAMGCTCSCPGSKLSDSLKPSNDLETQESPPQSIPAEPSVVRDSQAFDIPQDGFGGRAVRHLKGSQDTIDPPLDAGLYSEHDDPQWGGYELDDLGNVLWNGLIVTSQSNLPPLRPPGSPPIPPKKIEHHWTWNEEQRVYRAKFDDEFTPTDKEFLDHLMSMRDDITVITHGNARLLNNPILSVDDPSASVDRIAKELKDDFHFQVRRFSIEIDENFVEKQTECNGSLTMTFGEFGEYIERRKQLRKGETDENFFYFQDTYGKEQVINVENEILYLLDIDLERTMPHLHQDFQKSFRFRDQLPGGESCLMHHVSRSMRPEMGPKMYITPPGSFTSVHQDGFGTVDSGHLCVAGYNEVIMMRRLPEHHKRLALCLMNEGSSYDALQELPHDDGKDGNPHWPTIDLVAEFKRMGYAPQVFVLGPDEHVHIGKGKLHAFRKQTRNRLPTSDCHAALRHARLENMEPSNDDDLCLSVAWDWMYKGKSSQGINRETSTIIEASCLNGIREKSSLAIPTACSQRLAKEMAARVESGLVSPGKQPGEMAQIKGILPSLRSLVYAQAIQLQMIQENQSITNKRAPIPLARQFLCPLDAYGNDYFCEVCKCELGNLYLRCDGCESLQEKEFKICVLCHESKRHLTSPPEAHSHFNHNGKPPRQCSGCSPCRDCRECAVCQCRCHTKFSVMERFHRPEEFKQWVDTLSSAVAGDEVIDGEETEQRLKALTDMIIRRKYAKTARSKKGASKPRQTPRPTKPEHNPRPSKLIPPRAAPKQPEGFDDLSDAALEYTRPTGEVPFFYDVGPSLNFQLNLDQFRHCLLEARRNGSRTLTQLERIFHFVRKEHVPHLFRNFYDEADPDFNKYGISLKYSRREIDILAFCAGTKGKWGPTVQRLIPYRIWHSKPFVHMRGQCAHEHLQSLANDKVFVHNARRSMEFLIDQIPKGPGKRKRNASHPNSLKTKAGVVSFNEAYSGDRPVRKRSRDSMEETSSTSIAIPLDRGAPVDAETLPCPKATPQSNGVEDIVASKRRGSARAREAPLGNRTETNQTPRNTRKRRQAKPSKTIASSDPLSLRGDGKILSGTDSTELPPVHALDGAGIDVGVVNKEKTLPKSSCEQDNGLESVKRWRKSEIGSPGTRRRMAERSARTRRATWGDRAEKKRAPRNTRKRRLAKPSNTSASTDASSHSADTGKIISAPESTVVPPVYAPDKTAFGVGVVNNEKSPLIRSSEQNNCRKRWSESEIGLFLEGCKKYGCKWKRVAEHVGTRSRVQTMSFGNSCKGKRLIAKMAEDDASDEMAASGPKPSEASASPHNAVVGKTLPTAEVTAAPQQLVRTEMLLRLAL